VSDLSKVVLRLSYLNNKKFKTMTTLKQEIENLRAGNMQEELLTITLRAKTLTTEVDSLKEKLVTSNKKVDTLERTVTLTKLHSFFKHQGNIPRPFLKKMLHLKNLLRTQGGDTTESSLQL